VCADKHSEFCDFFETKNITSGEKFENGTILFDGMLYPEGYYRTYDYTVQNKNRAQRTESHIRGCFCKLIICVRICPRSDDFAGTVVVSRDNGTDEINLNNFGIIKSYPIFDISKEVVVRVNGNISWNIYEVFKLRCLIDKLIKLNNFMNF
jgi:hypothetical protein